MGRQQSVISKEFLILNHLKYLVFQLGSPKLGLLLLLLLLLLLIIMTLQPVLALAAIRTSFHLSLSRLGLLTIVFNIKLLKIWFYMCLENVLLKLKRNYRHFKGRMKKLPFLIKFEVSALKFTCVTNDTFCIPHKQCVSSNVFYTTPELSIFSKLHVWTGDIPQ